MDLPVCSRQRRLWHSQVAQFARSVNQQKGVDIGHELLVMRI
jgi:hypothetical protein